MAKEPRILSARATDTIITSNGKNYLGYRVGIYQPIARKADGVKTLRLVGNVGPPFIRKKDAEEYGEQFCSEHEDEYFFVPKVSHGYLFERLPEGILTYFDFIEAME